VLFWRWYRTGSRAWWLLPLAIAGQVAWAWYLWRDYRGFLPWLLPAAIVAGGLAIVVLAAARLSRRVLLGAGVAAGTVGVAAMLAAPAAWSASVLDAKYAGSSFDASAGPGGGFGPGGGARAAAGGVRQFEGYGRFREGRPRGEFGEFPGGEVPGGGNFPGGGNVPGGGNAPGGGAGGGPGGAGGGLFDTATTLTGSQLQLYRYLTAHRDGARYLFAVQGWTAGGPYILATGQAVLPMGGFSGSVPEPTLARVKQLVTTGQLRFFMLGGGGFAGPGGLGTQGGGETAQIEAWVESSCHAVQVPGADSTGTLYQCGTR